MAISTNQFKNGMTIEHRDGLWQIVEFQHVKPGKGGAFVRTKLKNVKTGQVLEETFTAGRKFEVARVENRKMQYLYRDGDTLHFMDSQTYEQIALEADFVGDAARWIVENMVCEIQMHDGVAIGVEPPTFVELKVTHADPGVKGDTATAGTKPATLETGAVVQVPLFVQVGDAVKVDTRTGDYLTRV
jgi:elongation factor P